jgi:epoxide hydrolase-like predicted phosphatase
VTGAEAVIFDWGGVLTSPLLESFAAFQEKSGVPLESLGRAMAAVGQRTGTNPLFELETGRLSERDFLAALAERLVAELGRPVDMGTFADAYFAGLRPNEEMIAYARKLRRRGLRLAILTNNVREWSQRWRLMVPVDELFDVVIDSSQVGTRKPDRRIYELMLAALGDPSPEQCVFLDDVEVNCDAAREIGMHAVWFRSNDQAIHEIEARLVRNAHSGGD